MKVTYKELHKLIDKGIKLKVNTPNGICNIKNKFLKKEKGLLLTYNDNTFTNCAITHWMKFNGELKNVQEINVGDICDNSGKIVIKKEILNEQNYYDFEVDHESGLYYQNDIIHHNSGKSLTIALIAEFFRRQGKKGILLVPNINLLTQIKADFEDYKLFDLVENTHIIGGGNTDKHFNKSLTISTWQSLNNYREDLDKIDFLMGDECIHPKTLIKTDKGNIEIQNLKKDDNVLTYNETTFNYEYKPIEKVHKNLMISSNEKMYELELENGKKIKITGNHKVLTKNGWKRTDMLTLNDDIIDLGDYNV